MDRREFRKALLGAPAAVATVGAFVCLWQTPRDWVGGQFADLGHAMRTDPWVTVLVTLLVVAYLSATLWTFVKAGPAPVTAGDLQAAEIAKEQRTRRRKMIDDARNMVANHELQKRRSWDDTMRFSPEFAAIRPHLRPSFFQQCHAVIFPNQKQVHEHHVERFVQELDRLEREWGLS